MSHQHPMTTTAADHIRDARNHLTQALTHLHRTLPPATTLTRLQPQGDPGCLAHRKAGRHAPSGPVKGACRWCYDFQRAHGRQPPPELIHHHDAGYPLSPTMLTAALKKPTGKKKPANPWNPTPKPATKKPPTRRQRMLQRIHTTTTRIAGW